MLQIWYVTYRYLCKIAILVWLLHTVCPRMDAIVDINDEKKRVSSFGDCLYLGDYYFYGITDAFDKDTYFLF